MTYCAGRLYIRTKRGVHVNPFDRVPLYRRQSEETSDLMDMGQISIVEGENADSIKDTLEIDYERSTAEEIDKDDTL
jgi:hypothetical protein